jgi:hypothetical protein
VCLVSASVGEGKGNYSMSWDFPEFEKSGRLPAWQAPGCFPFFFKTPQKAVLE